jgi:hypothetical protein
MCIYYMSIWGPTIECNTLPEDSLINTLNNLIDSLNNLINILSKSSDNNNLDTRKIKRSESQQLTVNDEPANRAGLHLNTATSYLI